MKFKDAKYYLVMNQDERNRISCNGKKFLNDFETIENFADNVVYYK